MKLKVIVPLKITTLLIMLAKYLLFLIFAVATW